MGHVTWICKGIQCVLPGVLTKVISAVFYDLSTLHHVTNWQVLNIDSGRQKELAPVCICREYTFLPVSLLRSVQLIISVGIRKSTVEQQVLCVCVCVCLFRKAKLRRFHGNWTESLHSYDASMCDIHATDGDHSALTTSSETRQQEPQAS